MVDISLDPEKQGTNLSADQKKSSKSSIQSKKRQFQEPVYSWLDVERTNVIFSEDDPPIINQWTKIKLNLDQTFKATVKNSIMIVIYFMIYAILTYIFPKPGHLPMDDAVQAFFLPVMPYILVAYRGLDKYIKAILLVIGSMIIIVILLSIGLITWRGIIYIKWIVSVLEFFGGPNNTATLNNASVWVILQFSIGLLAYLFIFEFGLLVIYHIFKRSERVHFVLSQKTLFIRGKSKTSRWSILYLAFWILLNPFNLKQYHDIYTKIRYNRETAKIGTRYDFSRVPLSTIVKTQAFEESKRWGIFIGLLCIGLGFLSGLNLLLIFLGLVIFIINIIPKKTYTISLYINRSKIEGSWHLTHDKTILKLTNLKPEVANLFTPIQFPSKKKKIRKIQVNS